MKYLKKIIESVDKFTPQINLNIEDEEYENKSMFGGICFIIINIFILTYTVTCSFKIRNENITNSILQLQDNKNIILNKNSLLLFTKI